MHDDDDNVWLWTLGGPALIGVAVWSAVVFSYGALASKDAEQAVVAPIEHVEACVGCVPVHSAYTAPRDALLPTPR